MNLIHVLAKYRDPAGQDRSPSIGNALLAEDLAPKWEAWRQLVFLQWGVELYISPPEEMGTNYTRAMFRTPADQAWLLANRPGVAGTLDASTHQAGRAVDLDLGAIEDAMNKLNRVYRYKDLVSMAAQFGFVPRVYNLNGTEPWHFDDNAVSAGLFPTPTAAVQAVGNTSAQVNAATAAGADTPQQAAVKEAEGIGAAGLLVAAGLIGAGAWALMRRKKGKGRK